MNCNACFNIQSERARIALEHCRKINFSIYVHSYTYRNSEQCHAGVILLLLRKNYILSRGLCISGSECNGKLKISM